MSSTARKVEYFHIALNQHMADAYDLLHQLARLGVNFAALTSVPTGPESTQMTLFPEDAVQLQNVAKQIGLTLTGPHPAVLVQGDDEVGALAHVHKQLREENVDVYATSAIADGMGHYGCVLYVRKEDADRAIRVLKN